MSNSTVRDDCEELDSAGLAGCSVPIGVTRWVLRPRV